MDLAEIVVQHGIFPTILNCLKNKDMIVKKNAATCIREISRQSRELSQLICQSGGEAALVDFISTTKGVVRLPGIMTLGYIASFDEQLAMRIIEARGIKPLKQALVYEQENHIKAAAA